MTTISAKSILASRHALDPTKGIYTLLLHYPRCIHAEFMTHRVFSRNASSSRAIPIMKMIRSVLEDPFVPIYWGANQKGMQAKVEIAKWKKPIACFFWLALMYLVIGVVLLLHWLGLHKQIANRLLEPWMHINVLVTGDQWSNFLALRDHPDAEPHIQILAQEVRKALDEAEVQVLNSGQWHLPFVGSFYMEDLDDELKMSVACCASTSYKTVEGFDMTYARSETIYNKLLSSPMHASPFEHQAQADDYQSRGDYWFNEELSGNLGPGWIQFRKTLKGECL